MKNSLRVLLLSMFFLSIQFSSLWAQSRVDNKTLSSYDSTSLVIDSLNNKPENEFDGGNTINPYVIIALSQSIPTPVEIAILIQDLDTSYHKEKLNDTQKVDNFDKALNFGVYSIDFGYANLFQEHEETLNYLNATKKIADELTIGQFLDFTAIQELSKSSNNLDALLQFSLQKFDSITVQLANEKREHIALLMLTGSWLESVYLISSVYEDSHNEELKNKLGEQKLVLDQILLVLNVYKDKPNFQSLINELEILQKNYTHVEIVEKNGMPRMEIQDGEIIIVDTKEIVVTISDKDAEVIINQITSIRNQIISN